MQLGAILQQRPGVPCVMRQVLVRFLHDVDGVEHITEIPALLAPISEPRFEEARRFAEDWLLRQDPTSPYRVQMDAEGTPLPARDLPEEVLDRERDRVLLLFALRDPDKPAQPLVQRADYGRFRKGLIRRQVNHLLGEWLAYLREQYPETVGPDEAARLAEEAEKKS